MNGIKLDGFDIEKLRERLRKMTDAQLLEFGRADPQLCSPKANFGKPPREVFVIQLKEARAEWRRIIRKDHGRTPYTPSCHFDDGFYGCFHDSAAGQFHENVVADFVFAHIQHT